MISLGLLAPGSVAGGTFSAENAVGLGVEIAILAALVASLAVGIAYLVWARPDGERE